MLAFVGAQIGLTGDDLLIYGEREATGASTQPRCRGPTVGSESILMRSGSLLSLVLQGESI